MGDPTLIGLGFQGAANSRFQSTNPNIAPGGADFYACVLVNLQQSLSGELSYFGNFAANIGWEIGRGSDTPASDPPNSPETVSLQVKIGNGGATTTLSYAVDAMSMFGRTHLISISLIAGVASLHINGATVASETLSDPLTLGHFGLTYGNIAGGGQPSGDPIISAAYSDTDADAFLDNQRLLFEAIRTTGKLVTAIASLGLTAQFIYESFQQKAPTNSPPSTPLKNFGVLSTLGDLTFVGSVALSINVDTDPDYTGGSQSSSTGPGGVNLQDAYDSGPTGLIVTDVGIGPVGVDELRLQDSEVSTEDAAAPATLSLLAGSSPTLVGGAVTIASGAGGTTEGTNAGGLVEVTTGAGGDSPNGGAGGDFNVTTGNGGAGTGNANAAGNGGSMAIQAGDGGIADSDTEGGTGGNILIAGGAGSAVVSPEQGAVGGTGGQIIIHGGPGGDAADGSAIAGSGAEVNIEAGRAGFVSGGATSGVGGLLSMHGGSGNTGTGGNVHIGSGDGDIQSGDLRIDCGTHLATPGLMTLRGSTAAGIGSGPGGGILIIGGAAAVGEDQIGGTVQLEGGTSAGIAAGGNARVFGGAADDGPGGGVTIAAADGGLSGLDLGGFGGTIAMYSGGATQPNQPAGEISITGGNASGTGGPALGGNIQLRAGDSTASTGGAIIINAGIGASEIDAGSITVAFNATGGFTIVPTNNRISLNTYGIGGGVSTGSLKVHTINTAGEAAQAITDGLFHFRTEQAGGTETTLGFRAAKSGNYGLVGRIFQRTFTAAEGVSFAVTHNLDCNAPGVFMYNSGTGALIPLVSVVQNSTDQVTVTIGGAVNGFVTVIGF